MKVPMEIKPTEFVWVINPKGRPVEVPAQHLAVLLKQGYRKADENQLPKPDIEKEFLEGIEL